tara:strand:+ start:399 stop:1325 length:927 start_codon:yes stop_codon:yes gene_type:complete
VTTSRLKTASILKIIPYFGKWPAWIDLYLESCRHNPDISWLFYTDCGRPATAPANVQFIETTFEDYKKLVSARLDIDFNPTHPYKLCDLKPAFGFIHQDQLTGYDFFAFGDIDIIYGRLGTFLTERVLQKYNVISSHERRLSGHFSLFRNNEKYRNAFRKIPHWQQLLENDQHLGIDESAFSKVFLPHRKHPKWLRSFWSLSSSYQRNTLYKEQYSTVLSPMPWWDGRTDHPQQWFWQNGTLTNGRDGEREFMYLHFMNWKSNTWLPKPLRNEPSAWMKLNKLVRVDIDVAAKKGFKISPEGFTAIDS